MTVKYIPIVTVKVPVYDRHQDSVEDHEVNCMVRMDEDGSVIIVPESSTPTKPYLVRFDPADIEEVLKSG